MIGIYKVTAPDGKIYIGQSLNIKGRFIEHKKEKSLLHPRLFASFAIWGFEKHIFDIIIECSRDKLNYWERYYQDLFDVCGKNGLNCRLTKTDTLPGTVIQETRDRMSESGKIKIFSKAHRAKLSYSAKNRDRSNVNRDIHGRSKLVFNTQNGIFYASAREASESINMKYYTIKKHLSGISKNKTCLVYA